MQLTSIARVHLPDGRLRSHTVRVASAHGRELPISFDQHRHVGAGVRPGSWMAVSFRPAVEVSTELLGEAWHAVVARHGTLRSAFSLGADDRLRLHEVDVLPGPWVEHRAAGRPMRENVRDLFDDACNPFSRPSHRLCLIEPPDEPPVVLIGADHAHVDAWSLLVLVRDLQQALDDLTAGRPALEGREPPASFADHSAWLAELPAAPQSVHERWRKILDASDRAMPTFPLPLGDVTSPRQEVVEVHHVLDARELARLEKRASDEGVRMIALAVSAMTSVFTSMAGVPLRAVFPVHSRHEERWHDAVGWFITNAVIESTDPSPAACMDAVREAVRLGSYPLAPLLAPFGDVMSRPGMFAISWLDNRKLPVVVDPALAPQHISAVVRTDGVMIWFVVNDDGLTIRCRYPDTRQAKRSVGEWLDQVCAGIRACV